MTHDNPKYGAYCNILREELVPAMGCTKLIAPACCPPDAGRLWASRA